MTITRERQPDFAGWENRRGGDPRAGQRPNHRVRHFHRKYAGGGVGKPCAVFVSA